MKLANRILGLAILMMAQLVVAQQSSLNIGENTKLNAGALFTFGYQGDYGDAIPSDHGLNLGFDGKISGYYYNPNFLSFTANPYYDQSRADSDLQSLTGAKGVNGTANLFTGSHFPGSVSYHYDRQQHRDIWIDGTAELHDGRQGAGIRRQLERVAAQPANTFGGIFSRQRERHALRHRPARQFEHAAVQRTLELRDRRLPLEWLLHPQHGEFGISCSFSAATDRPRFHRPRCRFRSAACPARAWPVLRRLRPVIRHQQLLDERLADSRHDERLELHRQNENATRAFIPHRSSPGASIENYTSNLTGYLAQSLSSNGTPVPGLDLGTGSHSSTFGGGATYQLHKLSFRLGAWPPTTINIILGRAIRANI